MRKHGQKVGRYDGAWGTRESLWPGPTLDERLRTFKRLPENIFLRVYALNILILSSNLPERWATALVESSSQR